jgi:hypothetical protein
LHKGLNQALVDPIKGKMRENILEWMQIGLCAHPWCVIKHILPEEGFFLFASGMIVSISFQKWR